VRNLRILGLASKWGAAFLLSAICLLALPAVVSQSSSYSLQSFDIVVYRDGLVHVKMEFSVNATEPSISARLLASSVANVLAVDQSSMPLDYVLSASNVTIFSLGASKVTLEYDTLDLTKKDGRVWTLTLDTPYELRAVFPQNSTIIAMNMPPRKIEIGNNAPILTLSSGHWEISYVFEILATASYTTAVQHSTSSSVTQPSSETPSSSWILTVTVATVALAAVGLVGLRHVRSRAGLRGELTSEDREILELISSSGGRILESQLRDKLGIPKATAWRHVRKLERLGLIRVRRLGLQNEIELVS